MFCLCSVYSSVCSINEPSVFWTRTSGYVLLDMFRPSLETTEAHLCLENHNSSACVPSTVRFSMYHLRFCLRTIFVLSTYHLRFCLHTIFVLSTYHLWFCLRTIFVLSTYHLRFCLCTIYSSAYVQSTVLSLNRLQFCLCLSMCMSVFRLRFCLGIVYVLYIFCPVRAEERIAHHWTSTHIASKLGYFLHVCPYQLSSGPDPDPKTR